MSGEIGGVAEACPLAEEEVCELRTCYFEGIEVGKTGSTDHTETLVIDMSNEDDFNGDGWRYEVVSGENAGKFSNVDVVTQGITTSNCQSHASAMVRMLSAPGAFENSTGTNTLQAKYPYSSNGALSNRIKSYNFSVEACHVPNKSFSVRVAPDRKIEVSLKGIIALQNMSSDAPGNTLGIEVEVKMEWDTNRASVKGILTRTRSANPPTTTWRVTATGSVDGHQLTLEGSTWMMYARFLKTLYDGKLLLEHTVSRRLIGETSTTVSLGFAMNLELFYKNQWKEHNEGLLVGLSDTFGGSGTFFSMTFTRDITSTLLTMTGGWVGWFLDQARQAMEAADIASLNVTFSITGAVSIENLSYEKLILTDGNDVSPGFGSDVRIVGSVTFTIRIRGRIRIDTSLYGVDVAVPGCGVRGTIITRTHRLKVEFTGMKLTVVVFHETSNIQNNAGQSAPTDLIPEDQAPSNTRTEHINTEHTIVNSSTITEIRL